MIKIDFHMHTIATKSDAPFEFDIESLKTYVSHANLNAIAITNHNMFDEVQYKQIIESVDIPVYPGIEINLESGHLLLISDGNDLDDFSKRCSEVASKISVPTDSISVDILKTIYPDLGKYIIIPHYDKYPPVSKEIIGKLSAFITAGEVTSPKKFIYCIKDASNLVPVYFSDGRMHKNLVKIPTRQTYLGCEDATFSSIRHCLGDKRKVSLSSEETSSLFSIFENGQRLSTGLNVVLGERSSGKSYTLTKIYKEQKDFVRVKYIEQFSLVTRDSVEDEKIFNKLLKEKHSLLSMDYLEKLKDVVSDIIDIDIEEDLKSVSDYIESLVKYANESVRHDIFSKSKLFSEEEFQILNLEGLISLIGSTKNLISNIEFKNIIEKHVSIEDLTKLYVELIEEYSKKEQERLKKKFINEIINDTKDKLKRKTAATIIEDVDFYKIAMNLKKVAKFEDVVSLSKNPRTIEKKSVRGFTVVAKSLEFEGAGELQKVGKSRSAYSNAYAVYKEPYKYIQELKKIAGLEESEFYKHLVKIEYKILNKDGFDVSGGERSEFNLLQEIDDAQKYDMLLIDEPESSFDNLFLEKEVNEIIRNISKNMPVVLSTHNNTVGASIKPDYILYTKKEVINSDIIYKVYSGCPTSKELVSTDGSRINTLKVTMDCLEAGEDTYNERKGAYENLKN